jgi:hypothetical protein
VPKNLIPIQGPVYVQASQIQGALLSAPIVEIPTTIDAVVRPQSYVTQVQSVPIQVQKRLLLLDEEVSSDNIMPL